MTNTDLSRLNDNKSPYEFPSLFLHEPPHSVDQALASIAREADQDDTGRVNMTGKD